MSLRIIYILERFLSASVGVWVSKNLSKDTRDTCILLHTKSALHEEILANSFFPFVVIIALFSTMKVKFGKCNVCVINLAID